MMLWRLNSLLLRAALTAAPLVSAWAVVGAQQIPGVSVVEAPRPAAANLEKLWGDLPGDDLAAANGAIWRMILAGDDAVRFLNERVQPVAAIDKQVTRLLAELSDPRSTVRERATRRLLQTGAAAEPLLRSTLVTTHSPEIAQRLKRLLAQLDEGSISNPEIRRRLRAIRVLERIGTPAAKDVLSRLAGGVPAARETAEAAAALERSAHFHASRDAMLAIARQNVGLFDWPQRGGTSLRNNAPAGAGIATDWDAATGRNIRWKAPLGSVVYGGIVVANGRVLVGTNNASGYVQRFPSNVDLGCLLCFDEKTGGFLWQYSARKHPAGRVHDWPMQGICSTPCVDGRRTWFVSSLGEVVCADLAGFHDGTNDGPFQQEERAGLDEADVLWKFDMMLELGSRQHNMANCSVTCAGDILFVNTSNGVDDGHVKLSNSAAPSFVALDRNTGRVLWTDASPGENILHGQWSSPAYGVLGGVPQVLFAGGDGWLYGFDPAGDGTGGSRLLWKFDCNPKTTTWRIGGQGTRNNIIATPVVYDGLVYVAVGQDPEHGEGDGHLWCIDPARRADGGDVSSELACDAAGAPLPPARLQAVDFGKGEFTRANPASAMVWHYTGGDLNGDERTEFHEEMHRTIGDVAISDGLLVAVDFCGIVHCLDARTGEALWTDDLLANVWGSPLIVEDKVYVGDEDGEVIIYALDRRKKVLAEVALDGAIYTTPVVANNVLYLANRNTLYAVAAAPR